MLALAVDPPNDGHARHKQANQLIELATSGPCGKCIPECTHGGHQAILDAAQCASKHAAENTKCHFAIAACAHI